MEIRGIPEIVAQETKLIIVRAGLGWVTGSQGGWWLFLPPKPLTIGCILTSKCSYRMFITLLTLRRDLILLVIAELCRVTELYICILSVCVIVMLIQGEECVVLVLANR